MWRASSGSPGCRGSMPSRCLNTSTGSASRESRGINAWSFNRLREEDKTRTIAGASASVLRLEPPCLHAVSANLHVTPAAGTIFAGIEKEPAALGILARAQALHVIGDEQTRRTDREHPQRQFRSAFR